MKEKLHSILLIDDDAATNFIHEIFLEENNYSQTIITKTNCKDALEFLANFPNENRPFLVFLDINMPAMNGWEFLYEFRMLAPPKRENVKIVMLSTSLNQDDEERALSIPEVTEFLNKPLTTDAMDNVLKHNFPELM